MASDFDRMVEDLQKQMWAGYSPVVVDHAQNPRNVGRIQDADGSARVTGPCGDTMEISLRICDGVVEDAAFQTDGCGTTIVAGSMVTELAKGKGVAEALELTQQDVLDALGGLPEESVHCALLAANTLKQATKDYQARKREPRKRD